MIVATIINFLLSSLNTGAQIAYFVLFVRKALILDTDYPLSEQTVLVTRALRNASVVSVWATYLPVSVKLLLLDPVLIIHGLWRHFSPMSLLFGGRGPSFQIDGG